MSYTPPSLPLAVTWAGEPAYKPGAGRVIAQWGTRGGVVFQPIWPTQPKVGKPLVRELYRIRVSGFFAGGVGQAGAFDSDSYIPPAWDRTSASWFGEGSYIAPTGVITATWHVSDALVVGASGIPSLLELGTPTLLQSQLILPSGLDALRSGRTGVRFWWQYIPDDGEHINVSWVGKPHYTPPLSDETDGHWTLSTPDVGVSTVGWYSQAMGTPGIGLFQQYVRPSTAWSGAQFGRALGRNVADSLRPPSFDALRWTQPRIYNRNQYILAAGNIKPTLVLGKPEIFNRTRYIRPVDDKGSNNHARAGTPTASHGIRRILPPQIAAPAFPSPWVSRSPRMLSPTGFDTMRFAWHVVAPTRFIQVVGTEMTRWLTRIIPEEQRVTPQGLRATQWGDHLIRTRWQFVRAQGFKITFQSQEENRFGRQYAYNLRQYLRQTYDPEAGNAGERWGLRPEVYNRDKTLTAFGQPMQRFGSPFVDNKARRLDPRAIAAPGVGLQFISHGVRRVRPDGVVAQTAGEWSVVFNGARQVKPLGVSTHYVPQPERVANTRRYYNYVTLGSTMAIGQAFIAPAIREIKFSFTQLIHPPQIDMPYVGLYTRYVEPKGLAVIDGSGTGYPNVEIRWNKMYPKWVVKDLFGSAHIRNLTPEHHTFGHNSLEFGLTRVRNEFERYAIQGWSATQWGGHKIMDKLQKAWPKAIDPQVIVRSHLIKKLMDDPPSTQWVFPKPYGNDQVSRPGFPTVIGNVIYVKTSGIPMGAVGEHTEWGKDTAVHNNALKIESGIYDHYFGEPEVSLKNRAIQVGPFPGEFIYEPPAQDVWPRTIWAVSEAPIQAILNHPGGNGNLVNNHGISGWSLGAICGNPKVYGRSDTITQLWYQNTLSSYGTPVVMNRRRYVTPSGTRMQRMGAPRFFGGQEALLHFESSDTAEFGKPEISRIVPLGPQTVVCKGIDALTWGRAPGATEIQLFNREVSPKGIYVGGVGLSLRDGSDADRYMRQSLWVGAPDWPVIGGGVLTRWGTTWVSYRNREVKGQGFSALRMEMDEDNFVGRMRVIRIDPPPPPSPPTQYVAPVGFDESIVRAPDVRPLRRFIRPDGNAFTFRQGVGSV